MRLLTTRRQKHWALFFVLLTIPGFLIWRTANSPETYIVLMTDWTEGNDSQTRATYVGKLVDLGPSSIPPLVDAVGRMGTFYRRTWQLNVALKRLGPPAHHQLLAAIKQNKDPYSRVRQVYSLQEAFNDFSRVNVWLTDLESHADTNQRNLRFSETYLWRQLQAHFHEEVPLLFVDSRSKIINPSFVQWYQTKTFSEKSWPQWKLKS